MEIEYYQGIREKILKAFQNIVAIFKIKSIDLWGLCFYIQGFYIFSRTLSILWGIIAVLSNKNFRNYMFKYMFKYLLGDCISKENSACVGLTATTLSRRLTMHLKDSSSIALHLKNHSIPKSKFRKDCLHYLMEHA